MPAQDHADTAANQPGSSGDLAFVLRQSLTTYWPIAIAVVLTLIEVAGTLVFPLLTKGVVERLGETGLATGSLMSDTGLMLLLGVLVFTAFSAGFSRLLLASSGLRIVANLKNSLIARLIKGRLIQLEENASGERTSRVISDSNTVSQLVTKEALNAASGALLLIGCAVIMFTLDVWLAAILFGVIGGAFLVSLPVVVTLGKVGFKLQDVTAKLSGRLTQVFSEIRLVKAFGREDQEIVRAEGEVESLRKLGMHVAWVEAMLQPLMTLAVTSSMVIILAYGGIRVAEGTLTAGTLTAFLLYVFAVVGPLAQISSFFAKYSAARGASGRMAQVLRMPAECEADDRSSTEVPATNLPEQEARKVLRLQNVSFTYPNADRPAVQIEELTIEPGSSTALIGPSGCGKSTTLALIERFFVPEAGSITYAGRDIADMPLSQWRSRIGYVPQSSAMLSGTVRENVCYGLDKELSDDEITAALDQARCSEFVSELPEGVDTPIGESGAKLSGGQKQRLALARVFARNPEILLLDEATSHLDEENEFQVVEALRSLMQGRTCIFVTHRMQLVKDMDRIVVMDDGRIADSGEHDLLLSSSLAYRRAAQREFMMENVA